MKGREFSTSVCPKASMEIDSEGVTPGNTSPQKPS